MYHNIDNFVKAPSAALRFILSPSDLRALHLELFTLLSVSGSFVISTEGGNLGFSYSYKTSHGACRTFERTAHLTLYPFLV
jgi:predicted sulfurtransferase